MHISATIITLNEEANIRRACDSLRGVADEIIVLDSGSQDRTREIALEYTPHVFTHIFENYSQQKNLAAAKASHPWILSVDADECLSEDLKRSLLKLKSEGVRNAVAGFRVPRLANYLGEWIRHSGWYPDFKTRLYHRDHARWVGEYVHESLAVNGDVEELSGDLLHYTVNSISEHIARIDRYTRLAANQYAAEGKHFSFLRCLFTPPLTFLRTYVVQLGILDGWRGLCIASFAGWYVFLKQVRLWEIEKAGPRDSGSAP